MTMFYSQLLLSKKGPFGTIWVAAHCHKKLKKDQVFHTDISASVDRILKDEVPAITYRILAYLLLGVVRIYSKKVEYLFHDCRGVLTEILQFASRKAKTSSNLGGTCVPESTHKRRATTSTVEAICAPSSELEDDDARGSSVPESTRKRGATTSSVEALCAPYSVITLPVRFELDSFDLELVDNARGDHVKSREAITLKDSWEDGRSGHHWLEKDRYDNETFEDRHVTFSPPREFRCNPSPASLEKLRDDNRFLFEERLDPMILSEGEEESEFGGVFDKDHATGGDHVKFSLPEMMVEESSELQGDGPSYGTQLTSEEKAMPSEMNSVETEKLHVSPDHNPVSITIDATPQSKMPNILDAGPTPKAGAGPTPKTGAGPTPKAGAGTPEFMAVRTPAPMERPRLSRKRKCAFDDIIVVPNNVLKEWIDDCSDLVCQRRKVPHTAKHVWKVHRMSNLPQRFLEPLIPIVPIDLKSLTTKKKLVVPEPPETSEMPAKSDGFDPIKTSETPAEPDGFGSPSRGFPEEEIIAPSTPVTRSTSVRFSELRVTSKSNEVGPASSFDTIEKELSPIGGNRELDKVLIDEEEVNSNGDDQQNDKWSARTRNVAGYLQKNFADRKKRGKDEALSLFQVLEGKTKKESARLFYELLVMKTGGYVEVKQDKAYGDIMVKECPKLKKACEAEGS